MITNTISYNTILTDKSRVQMLCTFVIRTQGHRNKEADATNGLWWKTPDGYNFTSAALWLPNTSILMDYHHFDKQECFGYPLVL